MEHRDDLKHFSGENFRERPCPELHRVIPAFIAKAIFVTGNVCFVLHFINIIALKCFLSSFVSSLEEYQTEYPAKSKAR